MVTRFPFTPLFTYTLPAAMAEQRPIGTVKYLPHIMILKEFSIRCDNDYAELCQVAFSGQRNKGFSTVMPQFAGPFKCVYGSVGHKFSTNIEDSQITVYAKNTHNKPIVIEILFDLTLIDNTR